MILRDATAHDAVALAAFDVGGPPSAWLDEVTEIVSGLISWQHDHDHQALDRRVIVADIDGQIVALCAHERIERNALISGRAIATRPAPPLPTVLRGSREISRCELSPGHKRVCPRFSWHSC